MAGPSRPSATLPASAESARPVTCAPRHHALSAESSLRRMTRMPARFRRCSFMGSDDLHRRRRHAGQTPPPGGGVTGQKRLVTAPERCGSDASGVGRAMLGRAVDAGMHWNPTVGVKSAPELAGRHPGAQSLLPADHAVLPGEDLRDPGFNVVHGAEHCRLGPWVNRLSTGPGRDDQLRWPIAAAGEQPKAKEVDHQGGSGGREAMRRTVHGVPPVGRTCAKRLRWPDLDRWTTRAPANRPAPAPVTTSPSPSPVCPLPTVRASPRRW